MPLEVMASTFDGMCRTCLSRSEKLFPMFDATIEDYPYAVDFLQNFCKIMLSPLDNLPQKVCGQCADEIKRAYAFKIKCEVAADTLNKYLEQINKDKISQSSQIILTNMHMPFMENPVKLHYPTLNSVQKEVNMNSIESISAKRSIMVTGKSPTVENNVNSSAWDATYLDNDKKIKRVRICSDQKSKGSSADEKIAPIRQYTNTKNRIVVPPVQSNNIGPEISQTSSINQSLENIDLVNGQKDNVNCSADSPVSIILVMNDDEYLSDNIIEEDFGPIATPERTKSDKIQNIVLDTSASEKGPVISQTKSNFQPINIIDPTNRKSNTDNAGNFIEEDHNLEATLTDIDPEITEICSIIDDINSINQRSVNAGVGIPRISQICSINQRNENINTTNFQGENVENGRQFSKASSTSNVGPIISQIHSFNNQPIETIPPINRQTESFDCRVQKNLVQSSASVDLPESHSDNQSNENIVSVEVEFINFPSVSENSPRTLQNCSINQSIGNIDSNHQRLQRDVTAEEQLISFLPLPANAQCSNKQIDRSDLIDNGIVLDAIQDSYVCHLCSNVILGNKNFFDHVSKHKPDTVKDLNEKLKQINQIKSNKAQAVVETLPVNEVIVEDSFICDKCGQMFNNRNNFTKHQQSHMSTNEINKEITEISDDDVCETSTTRIVNVQRRYLNNKYGCNICNQEFPTSEELNTHQSVAHSSENRDTIGKRKFKSCHQSDIQAKQDISTNHEISKSRNKLKTKNDENKSTTINAEKKPKNKNAEITTVFSCKYCSKIFIKEFQLRTHLVGCQFNKLPFNCGMCSMSFKTDDALSIHMGTHDDD